MEWFIAGISFGFIGSGHCIGMCGPLALGLPGSYAEDRLLFVGKRLLYNFGRVITYTMLGLFIGLLGMMIQLAGFQRWLSIGAGIFIILIVLVPRIQRWAQRFESTPSRFFAKLQQPVLNLYRKGSWLSMLSIGLLNGLLPCGFVYMALMTAITAGSVATSMVFMMAFGLGTIPAMFLMSVLGKAVNLKWRRRIQRFVPVGMLIVGILLILRGFSLGVMFSPDVHDAFLTDEMCRFIPFVEPPAN